MKAILDYFTDKSANPAEALTAAEEKIKDFDRKIAEYQLEFTNTEAAIHSALLDDAFGQKGAEERADKLTATHQKLKAKIEATQDARNKVADELDGLETAKVAYEREQDQAKISAEAKAKLKKIDAAIAKAKKSAEAYRADLKAVGDISRIAATGLINHLHSDIHSDHKPWRGFYNEHMIEEFSGLGFIELAKAHLARIEARGFDQHAENPYQPANKEIQEKQFAEAVAQTKLQHAANRDYRNQTSRGAATAASHSLRS